MDNTSNLSLQELKVSLIQDLKNRVDDRILEESNFLLLEKLINNASDKTEAIAIAELGTTYKRTGFHFDKKLERLGTTIKYLKRNDELSFSSVNDSDLTHKLIIGDNYDALLNLSISHKGKVDIIYIDPPYGKDDMGDFADTNYNNAITRDNLLSMLYPRLILAKQLLTDDGVIICSIDDKNQAYIKCLFDDVFGEFCGNVISVETSVIAGTRRVPAMNGSIAKTAEYVLIYKKNGDTKVIKNLMYDYITGFDKHYSKFLDVKKNNIVQFVDYIKETSEILSEFKKFNFTVSLDNLGKIVEVSKKVKNWLYSDEIACHLFRPSEEITIDDSSNQYENYHMYKINGKWFINIDNHKFLNIFRYKERIGQCDDYYGSFGERQVRGNLWKGFSADGGNLNKEGGIDFKQGKKPLRLITQLINAVSDNVNAIILDFFAGSGTTGQAVLELNRKDGGKRTFIVCTNNEHTDLYHRGIAYDVTSKRLKRVMTGECYDGNHNFEWIKKNEPYGGNLEVLDISEVSNIEQREGLSPFDVIDEKLYGQDFTLSVEDKIRWVCENFAVTQKYLAEPKSEV